MKDQKRGLFLNIEGIDGAGKSSHVSFLKELFEVRGETVVTTREPGGTPLGEKLREMLLHVTMNLETEALLMFAARRESVAQVIEPNLAMGNVVITDRFTDSSFAFQSGGRGLDREKMETLERWVHPGLQPDLTLLFDVPANVARDRISKERVLDKFESEAQNFHIDTRNEYLRRAREFPDRFRIIDSSKPLMEVREQIRTVIDDFIDAKSVFTNNHTKKLVRKM